MVKQAGQSSLLLHGRGGATLSPVLGNGTFGVTFTFSRRSYPERLTVSIGTFTQGQ